VVGASWTSRLRRLRLTFPKTRTRGIGAARLHGLRRALRAQHAHETYGAQMARWRSRPSMRRGSGLLIGFESRVALFLIENGGGPLRLMVTTADIRGLTDSGAAAWQVQVQNPVGGTNRLAAHSAVTTRTMIITGSASQTFPSTARGHRRPCGR
jgi:hypothetical protein